jgi:hypothetical protein
MRNLPSLRAPVLVEPIDDVCPIEDLEAFVEDEDAATDISGVARTEREETTEPTELRSEHTRVDASPALRFRAWDADSETWLRLVELAEKSGKKRLAEAFRAALDDDGDKMLRGIGALHGAARVA